MATAWVVRLVLLRRSNRHPDRRRLSTRRRQRDAGDRIEWGHHRCENRTGASRRAIILADRREVLCDRGRWRGVWCVCDAGATVWTVRGITLGALAAANPETARPPKLVAARTAATVQAVAVEAKRWRSPSTRRTHDQPGARASLMRDQVVDQRRDLRAVTPRGPGAGRAAGSRP